MPQIEDSDTVEFGPPSPQPWGFRQAGERVQITDADGEVIGELTGFDCCENNAHLLIDLLNAPC